ncbi:hypothetical protein [Mycolicibacterium sp.]|uniref:hypothetical protein n=1 Tax=Mycolicibacterium sp. TaxID=2320850 RepID=UPI00093ED391|nr:hypothetical protein EB73_24550 [Mycobacterium sp. SWH-M3]
MQLAVRSYLATGVAVAGVGAMAVSPVAPPMPDVQVPTIHSSAAVELSALANPIEEFGTVFGTTFQNVVALAQQISADPAPILSQIVQNQLTSAAAVGAFVQAFGGSLGGALAEAPEQFQEALAQLAEGHVTQALTTVQNAILGPVVQAVFDTLFINPELWAGFQNALRQPIANALAVVDLISPDNIVNLLGPLLAPVTVIGDVTTAVGAAGDNIFAGIKAGDAEQVANALLHLGPNLTNAILNGDPLTGSAGLLGPNGIVKGLLTIRDLVAAAITPAQTTSALAEVASADVVTAKPAVTTVTLDVAPAVKEIEAPKTQAETKAAETVSAVEAATTTETAPGETVATPVKDATSTETAATEEAAAETPAKTDTASQEAGQVKESPKAVPGKTGTSTTKKANPLKDVGDGIRGALKNIGKGLKDAVSNGGKAKPAKSEGSTGSSSTGGSTSGSGSTSGGSSSGGASSGGGE